MNDGRQQQLYPLVRKLRYWERLDSSDEAAILSLPHTIKYLRPSDYIVREMGHAKHICVLLSGFAARSKFVGGGHRQILSVHMKGEVVDLQNAFLDIADHSVQMLTAGEVAVLPQEEITQLAFKHTAVGRSLWIDTLVDGSIFREWITNVGRRDGKTRIAHLFCELALRMKVAGLGELTRFEFPMTQEQLADATGLTPVHVNRSIKSLEAQGLIDRLGPRLITIGDWERLAEAGDFNSSYLHLRNGDASIA